jgi:basic membrane protein A
MTHGDFERPMTRHFVLVAGMAALLALLVLAGCAAQPQDCALMQVQCAGLVTDFGTVQDGISHEAWLALEDARSAGLLDRADFIETVDTRDREANIAALAASGYDIIITVGAGMTEETLAVARDFPALYFVGLQQSPEPQRLPGNYATLVFHEEQSGFLAGAVAGLITQSGRVAAVCEMEFIDSVRRTCDGFRSGAIYANPAIEVDLSYRSGPEELLFRDHKWGTETASLSVERGADVVFAVGEETAAAALEAAAQRGAIVIGAETDMYSHLPELGTALGTSAILDVRGGLLAMLQDMVEGRFRPGQNWGDVGLVSFRDFDGQLPPAARIRLTEITEDLLAGAILVEAAR